MTSRSRQHRKHSRSSRGDESSPIPPGEGARQLPLPPPFAAPQPTLEPVILHTIGHGTLPVDTLVALLHTHGIETVIDVRSSPYSRFVPHCNRETLASLLTTHGLTYEWAGDTLGGRPDDASCYHGGEVKIGKVDYAQVAQRPWFQAGLHALVSSAARQRAALLCSEEDPRRCHRHKLIANALHDLGVRVLHIRCSGELEEADTLDRTVPPTGNQQLSLGGFSV
jgi:uncharacterized protein (DUF488 family)